jgi:serine/threonine protein kinase
VLPFLGVLRLGDEIYLASPFADNGTLSEYLVRSPHVKRLPLVRFRARRWYIFISSISQIIQIAQAVKYLHSLSIVHGDIKAANVLIGRDGRALLCDFGLTRYDHILTSSTTRGFGTVRWQSPELWDGGHKSFASDVYAFGMTIVEVVG